jgi:hypothetical protein
MLQQSLDIGADRRFYKYVTRATGRIILETRSLRWSSPLLFNDPFDNQFDFLVGGDPQAATQLALSRLWAIYSDTGMSQLDGPIWRLVRHLRSHSKPLSREQFDHVFGSSIATVATNGERYLPELTSSLRTSARKHKILCLSLTAESLLMWAYYAEGHRGLALRFHSVDDLDSPWSAGFPVNYSSKIPSLFETETLADALLGHVSIDHRATLLRFVSTKSSEWAHEKEWRLFSGTGRDENADYEDIRFDPLELDGIIFGANMAEDDRLAFASLAQERYPHAAMLQAKPRSREFALDLLPVTIAS